MRFLTDQKRSDLYLQELITLAILGLTEDNPLPMVGEATSKEELQ